MAIAPSRGNGLGYDGQVPKDSSSVVPGFAESSTGGFARPARERSQNRRSRSLARLHSAKSKKLAARRQRKQTRGADRDKAVGKFYWPEVGDEALLDK